MTEKSSLDPIAHQLRETLSRLEASRLAERLWDRDPTLWPGEAAEIADRLGWLDLVDTPPQPDAELSGFTAAILAAGFSDAVLLGMGGSSLGSEALRASYGTREGYLRLHVLDSTHPDWVRRIHRGIDLDRALFLVASKSGTTAEVRALYGYFMASVREAGNRRAGEAFVGITDPGSPLEALAAEQGFRHVFRNPPDIGGRFSVLSRFGRVPAALTGIDTSRLLGRARGVGERCRPGRPVAENPGVWLGAVLGAAARSGRDKLTLLTSRRLARFGLWAEQLLAESTGKHGTGILPITGEPAAAADSYGDDRLFVILGLRGEDDSELTARARELAAAGQPVVWIELRDLPDLGGELFRWQLATAVAGHILEVQPFDQPDVEATKRATRALLAEFESTGSLSRGAAPDDLWEAIASERPSYIAFMAYTDEDAQLEAALTHLRRRLLRQHRMPTTFGYGPRFLHSTGQLHKGGAPGGLFVQLLDRAEDLPIPGRPYGFGTLLAAQAGGDLTALTERGRRTVRIDLGTQPAMGVAALAGPA